MVRLVLTWIIALMNKRTKDFAFRSLPFNRIL